jgi:hypothetical protein
MSVERRLARARNELLAAELAVQEVSAKRLGKILKAPAKQRFHHLNDPGLTPSDREILELSLTEELPDDTGWSRWIFDLAHWRRRPLLSGTVLVGALLLVCLLILEATRYHEAGQRAYFLQDTTVEWRYPSGRVVLLRHPAHSVADVTKLRGDVALIRLWTVEGGYANAWVLTRSLYQIH